MKKQNNIFSAESITKRLVEKIKASMPKCNAGGERLYSFHDEVDDQVPMNWLCIQKKLPKIYFSDREKNETAGLGAADIFKDESSSSIANVLKTIEDNLSSAVGAIRYYGSICFDQGGRPSTSWQKFGRFYFIIPEFEIRRSNNNATFVFNVSYKPGDRREAIIQKLLSSLGELEFNDEPVVRPFNAKVLSRADFPDKSKWKENVASVTGDLRSDHIRKVVLARKSVFQMVQNVDPVALLKHVSTSSINTYNFCFQLDESNAFIGCSPECLYSTNRGSIYTEAIAGTCLAGSDDIEQQRFQEKLLNCPKEAEEHEYVFDNVKSDLNTICSRAHVLDQRDILSLSYVQHFQSRFSGTLKDGINTQKIIETLHPTAAVNGYPKQAAKDQIRAYEHFSRGWYAGPVGWISADRSEFAVAIRSGLVQGKKISLFVGAGIVKSSDPESEWNETESKLKPFTEVIC